MSGIQKLFEALVRMDGSDLHLSAGRPPIARVQGEVRPMAQLPLDDEGLAAMLQELVSAEQWVSFREQNDFDFACQFEGIGRFRANYFCQANGVAAVFRTIPEKVLSAEALGLSPAIADLADLESGLALVTGPTGSGKSTTLAAIIDRINSRHEKHIVTIEDPVEFVHRNKRSVVSQRELGTDTHSFQAALRSAVRQDANVVLVGEMRDLETISLATAAASMGIVVFGTLHTSGAAKTVDRIIDAFPVEEQPQARTTLAETLAAVVSQILLPRIGGKGRVAAHEILLRTPALPGLVREGKLAMLDNLIASGRKRGMQTMDDSLWSLAEAGTISGADAYLKARDKGRFEMYGDP